MVAKSTKGRKRSPLKTEYQRFTNPYIFQVDAKFIDLERMMVNLFAMLKYDGRPAVRKKEVPPTAEELASRLAQCTDGSLPFSDLVLLQRWLESDFLNLVHRGEPGRQAIASLRPFHLDSYKIRNMNHCRDYGSTNMVYAMLKHGNDPTLVEDLLGFLGDDLLESGHTDLVSRVVGFLTRDEVDYYRSEVEVVPAPICTGQTRLLANDIRRLLCYRDHMPRPVLIRHMQTIMGLHMGIYTLRLARMLPAIVEDGTWPQQCRKCSVSADGQTPFEGCGFGPRFVVDMHQDGNTFMGALSRECAAGEYAQLNDFIRAVLALNQIWEYARTKTPGWREPNDLQEALSYWDPADPRFQGWADSRMFELHQLLKEHLPDGDWQAPVSLGLSPFATYVETVTHLRHKYHKAYLVRMLDSLFQKQEQKYFETGFVKQGRAKANGRRFHIASRLLETLVHLAVLRQKPDGSYRSQAVLVDDFIAFLYNRYGMVINRLTIGDKSALSIEELGAWRSNVNALKERLREIGFYTDLSDAYNAQTVRPRYRVGQEEA